MSELTLRLLILTRGLPFLFDTHVPRHLYPEVMMRVPLTGHTYLAYCVLYIATQVFPH